MQIHIEDLLVDLGLMRAKTSQITGFQIDSRMIETGNLFFALPGQRVDGHAFLAEVQKRGGIAAVVEKTYEGPAHGLELIRVDDVGGALRRLAEKRLSRGHARVVGITGSVGKTTTKELTAALLQARYRVGKSAGNHNTKLTLPLAILNGSLDADIWVLEMGASEPGDITRLIEMAPPALAVLTQISLAHVAQFSEGLTGIAREKEQIFSHPATRIALCPHELQLSFASLRGKEKVTFSLEHPHADYFISLSEGRMAIDERGVRAVSLPLSPDQARPQFLYNFAAAVAAARMLNMEWAEIECALPALRLPHMRFEQKLVGNVLWINDAYNANPVSMRVALSSMPEPQIGGRRIAVLASMKELGPFSEEAHREVGRVAGRCVDALCTLGEEAEEMHDAFIETKKPSFHCMEMETLARHVAQLVRPGDVVLVKGSRCMALERLLALLEIPCS